MNLKNSLKKAICFLLAVMMLFAAVGCRDDGSSGGKKKVIIKKKVIKTNKSEVVEEEFEEEEKEDTDKSTSRKRRELASKKDEDSEKYVEVYVPEFTSKYVNWAGPEGYVIVYSPNTPLNRVSAENLQKYFIEQYGLTENDIPIVKDTVAAATAKEILVGNTNRYTTKLSENKFAVTLHNDKLVFEGENKVMVEKAADWFMSVKKQDGKVAVLEGTAEDFKSKITVNGKELLYVWGDECDGTGGLDYSKWEESDQKDLFGEITIVSGDLDFNRYEGGRLRMATDRYYDEMNADIEYANGGVLSTHTDFVFRRGYLEARVRFPYMRGAWPALWTRSADKRGGSRSAIIPEEQLKGSDYCFEIDILEAFAATNGRFYNTIHKWYRFKDGSRAFDYQGNDITSQIIGSNRWSAGGSQVDTSTPAHSALSDFNLKVVRSYTFSQPIEQLNKEYHLYQFYWEENHLWFGVDGEWYSDYSIDPAFDGYSGNNNNTYGFDLYNFLLIDDGMYTPNALERGAATAAKIVNNTDLPIEVFVDYIRLYQDPTDTAPDKDGRPLSSIINIHEQE